MTRVNRTRSRTLALAGPGTVCWGPPGPGCYAPIGPRVTGVERCVDSHGSPWVDSSFRHEKGVFPPVTVSGTRVGGAWTYTISGVPLLSSIYDAATKPWTVPAFAGPAVLSDSALAAKALSNVNPNRPGVDIPVDLLEFRDIPHLLRDTGHILLGKLPLNARNASKAHLAAQFGWNPLISDMIKVLNFTKLVSDRERHLARLANVGSRFKRKLTKESWNASQTYIAFDSTVDTSAFSRCILNCDGTRTYWYSIRANLVGSWSERELQTLAFENILGLDRPSLQTLWAAMPWSWLIDWFSNCGDILGAYRSGIPWTWSGLCVMYSEEYKITGRFSPLKSGLTVSIQNPQSTAITHNRHVVSTIWLTPDFRIPYLTNLQTSILGSLAILRMGK